MAKACFRCQWSGAIYCNWDEGSAACVECGRGCFERDEDENP